MHALSKRTPFRHIAVAALIGMTLPCAPAVHADNSAAAHITRYDLISHGMTVGHGQIIRTPTLRDGKASMELRMVLETKVNLPFFKLTMTMDETWTSDTNGLIAYKLESVEDGQLKTIIGELHNGLFNFETTESDQKRVWTAPRTAFDLAVLGQPEPVLTEGETKKISVLDPSACTITERTYRGTGAAMLTIGKRQIMCRTIEIEGPGTYLRRWFITDEYGQLILREDGRHERGSYSRRAVSMDPEQAIAE